MGKHINCFGYSLWISDITQQEPDKKLSSNQSFYSPGVLAAYCMVTSLFVAIILYGINISRRGYVWRSRALIALSSLILVMSVLMPALNLWSTVRSWFLTNGLVALNLYAAEKPHFQRSIRNGAKQARWWLPLIWIGGAFVILMVLKIVFA